MALHYLLDGYNIIHKIPGLDSKKLESQRENLIYLIQARSPQGSRKNAVTIVFDGQPGFGGFDIAAKYPRVIFTSGETADDRIKKIVEQAKNKKNIVVVSDDKEIQFYVRSLGAKIMAVADFLSMAETQVSAPLLKAKNIPRNLEREITSEMEQIWIKKDD